jgi:hypothetical protein
MLGVVEVQTSPGAVDGPEGRGQVAFVTPPGIEMRKVPAGTFLMGNPKDEKEFILVIRDATNAVLEDR